LIASISSPKSRFSAVNLWLHYAECSCQIVCDEIDLLIGGGISLDQHAGNELTPLPSGQLLIPDSAEFMARGAEILEQFFPFVLRPGGFFGLCARKGGGSAQQQREKSD
jgi:hypothetical protein